MKKFTFILALVIAVSIPASAKQNADWKYLKTANNGYSYYYDANSVKILENGYTKYFYKYFNPGNDKTYKYNSTINCIAKTNLLEDVINIKDTYMTEELINTLCKAEK